MSWQGVQAVAIQVVHGLVDDRPIPSTLPSFFFSSRVLVVCVCVLVAYYKKADELSGQLANRDMEVVDPLKGQVKRLLKNPKGGVIFILLGAAHEPVIPAVQRKLGSNTPVTFEIIGNNPSIEESVALKARTGENLTEEEVARAAFAYHGINKVSEKLIAAGKTSPLMTRFQDISDSINSVAASLSIAEIETTCKGKKTQDVIINHPSAGIIRDVLAA